MSEPIRIANCSGFYGDRMSAPREMLEDGPIDFLTGDYLAELTMLILWKDRQNDPDGGYARTFLQQMEAVLGLIAEQGVKVVVNAGGLNPAGLALRLAKLADGLGLSILIGHVAGDDVLGRLGEWQASGHDLANMETGQSLQEAAVEPVTANAYLGAWGIVDALRRGAQIVVCGRVADASLVVGPAAWAHGWDRTDWDQLAGAVVAGHILECGAQATGGNYAFFQEVPGLEHPGFPLAEVAADGSFVVTKHSGTGGLVSVGTVTAQLLYEVAEPAYVNPDVVARLDTAWLDQVGPDRVRVSGVLGRPAPPTTKLAINYLGGYRNSMTLVLTGLDIEAKAKAAERALTARLGGAGSFESFQVRLARTDRPDPTTGEVAGANLTVTVEDRDAGRVGRSFSSAVTELALASYPGLYATHPPGPARAYGGHWPSLIPSQLVPQHVVVGGEAREIPATPPEGDRATTTHRAAETTPDSGAGAPTGPTTRVPLGTAFGARSGDKGGNANVGVWARSEPGHAWLVDFLTVAELRRLIPEAAELEVRRYELPNLRALNFVIVGILGAGVASSTRSDPQAKSLGEFLRARLVDLPVALLSDGPKGVPA
ncbi:MAG: DUF1446 domain-containing protein [Acidimicrobiia bacterium]|nr:DUF1446 domain-containing protein [Acidimicrobiia bacterium]